MYEYRTILERARDQFPAPEMSLDGLIRRRDRKQRNWRLGTALLALAVAAVAIAGVIRAFDLAEAPRPANLPDTPDAWSRVVLDPGEDVRAITAGGPGLVAVGHGPHGAAVWTSSEGRTWSRVDWQELGVGGSISDVTTGDPGLVAVGEGFVEEAPVWISEDGLTWSRVPFDPVFQGASLRAVVAAGPGLVAVGHAQDGAAAWYSADGVTWERASVPPVDPRVELGGNQEAFAFMVDVASAGHHLFAVGRVALKGGSEQMIAWTSTDGMTWTELPQDPEVFPGESLISAVAGGGGGLIAVGTYRNVILDADGSHAVEAPAVWTSTDGLSWRRVPSQDAFVSRWPTGEGPGGKYVYPPRLRSVVAGTGGYVAVGGDGQCIGGGCPSAEAAVWTSTDGETWVRVLTGPVFQIGSDDTGSEGWVDMWGVIAWGSRFVAWGEYDVERAIWISERPGG